jgi:hypothetical protein
VPQPGPGEVLIKIMASGVCHTDLHAADGDWPVKPTLPFIPGHEGAGIVAALGPGVVDLKEGDAVGLAWLHDACGRCEHCAGGWETLCERQHNSGYGVNGSFAEYAIGHANYVARLPANADFAQLAPILCAGVTTYKGIKETEARPGEWLAISGVGGLGHLAVQYGCGPRLRAQGKREMESPPPESSANARSSSRRLLTGSRRASLPARRRRQVPSRRSRLLRCARAPTPQEPLGRRSIRYLRPSSLDQLYDRGQVKFRAPAVISSETA